MTPGHAGLWFGGGVLLSNCLSFAFASNVVDFFSRRGFKDALPRAASTCALLGAIPACIAFLLSDAMWVLVLWCLGAVFYMMPFVLCPTGIQLITPNRYRATVSSGYILLTNIVGLALGPTLVAIVAEHGFKSPLALGKALSILCAVALPAGAGLMRLGYQTYARASEASGASGADVAIH
jgi:hypothetical protein